MSKLHTQPKDSTPEPEEKKRRWLILIFIFVIFVIVTTGFVGFILGKGSLFSDDLTGSAIDTIHVTQPEAKIHLGGKIYYSDGTPYAEGIVQMHSKPRQTTTDGQGAFVFENTEGGSHRISIVDETGNVLAEREVHISKEDIENGAKVELLKNDTYQVEVAVDIKYLEVQVMIDKKDGKLYINPDRVTYLTEEGIVVSPTGRADIKNGLVVTPVGNVITIDGTIICGSGENENHKVIIPSGTLINKADGTIETPDGTQIRLDGAVISKNTVIDTQGVSITPDGKVQKPGDSGYQILEAQNQIAQIPLGKETEELISSGGRPDSTKQSDAGSSSGTNPGSSSAADPPTDHSNEFVVPEVNTPGIHTPGTGTSGTDTPDPDTPDPDTPDPDNPDPDNPDPDIPDPPEDPGPDNGVAFAGGTSEGQLASWEQTKEIALFGNRTGGASNTALLSPGAEGYYLFRVSNDNHFSISIDLTLSETDLHLPLEFAIADESGNRLTDWTALAEETDTVTDKITLANRGSKICQIKWRWPYHTSDKQDAADTKIGELKERSYHVNLTIRAKEQ